MSNNKTSSSPLLVIVALFFLTPLSSLAQDWQLVWTDEFETQDLDTTKWEYMYGTGSMYGLNRWGNYEEQYYTDREENIFVEDGNLHIVAREENRGGMNYTSARIRSKGKADFRYGKFEIRAKLPEGQGLWPAIWMLPTEEVYGEWPQSGEIDIMELIGHEPDVVHGTVHYGPPWPDNQSRGHYYTLSEGKFSDDFHVFTIEWMPDRITWYVDDNFFTFVTPSNLEPHNWPFDEKFHLLLNVAVGGIWPGSPDGTTEFPQEMIVDWIRVYQDAELTSSEADDLQDIPSRFALHQNHPNPFNPTTNISFDLPEAEHVNIRVYDMLGRQVAVAANDNFQAGNHTISFDASSLSSGTYIYRIVTDSYQQSRTMQLIK
ncbi:family 16 glycosylhydrolase [Natronogracilivirga saccharolytica]|uniref:Family 16 glycosylhydrolase n=1 Tax=Natronogracilivirga saccharolytica TaxID=2812953 RepID=A0A8J7S2W7_9BACT|nr:family 16 glycosylhydrolase [Natronogracilivirga saccharolytica]MBP3191083.1 family 16 glycosylhydrolase [Natronogracilivirga saccharolytica]